MSFVRATLFPNSNFLIFYPVGLGWKNWFMREVRRNLLIRQTREWPRAAEP